MSTRSPERTSRPALFVSVSALALAALALGFTLHATLRERAAPAPGAEVLASPARGDLAPGAPVVARWQDAFWEATVVSVQGELVVIAWDQPPPELSYRPRGWLARTDRPPASAKVGDWLLCPADRGVWQPCHVETVDGDVLQAIAIDDARPRTVALGATLPVPAGLAERTARLGEAALERARLAARLEAVEPVTAGKPVKARDRVLARWTDGSWWEAEVAAMAGDQITVAWADGSAPTAVPAAHVAALADAPRARKAGELALCKWGQGTRWWSARIDEGAAGLEVAYSDGTREPLQEQCITGRAPQP
jgi:hypothetical protein